MRAIRARTMSPLQMLKARLAGPLRPLLDSAVHATHARALGRRLAAAGTASVSARRAPAAEDPQRNVLPDRDDDSALRDPAGDDGLRHLRADGVHRIWRWWRRCCWCRSRIASTRSPAACCWSASSTPRCWLLPAFFSREGGAHLQYIIAAAAAVRHLRTAAPVADRSSSSSLGLGLHLYVWFWFPADRAASLRTNRRLSIRSIPRRRSPPSC